MTLSSSRIFDIFFDQLKNFYEEEKSYSLINNFFNDFLPEFYCSIKISKLFKGWSDIDCTSTVLLLFIAEELVEKKREKLIAKTLFPDFIEKNIMENIYKLIWNEYKECCSRLKFIPSVKGMETILEKREIKKSKN